MPTPSSILINPMDAFIQRYKDFAIDPSNEQIKFAEMFFNIVDNDNDTSMVTVLPGRCGIGKTTCLQTLISYFTQYDNYNDRHIPIGMVVITDELERLNNLMVATAPSRTSLWANNYKKYEKHCTYISNENLCGIPIKKQLIDSSYKPIVLLTTQRYFSMPEQHRKMLFSFKMRGNTYKRELFIFDEKPYFNEIKEINVKNFSDCSAAINLVLPSNCKKKDWILDEFLQYRNKMESRLREMEKCEDNIDRFYWKDSESNTITSDDKIFVSTLKYYEKLLIDKYTNIFDDIEDFQYIQKTGAFFCTQKKYTPKNQSYKTYFQIIKDHKSKFYLEESKAKFIVLDATASIDPEYRLKYINMVNCDHLNRPLKLKLNMVNVNTSRSKLINNTEDNYLKGVINSVVDNHNDKIQDSLLITYKQIERLFLFKGCKVAHFGGLRGTNEYLKYLKIGHIGLNRYSDFTYFAMYLSQYPDEYDKLKNMDEVQSREYIKKMMSLKEGLFCEEAINDIMFDAILSDFEQNIFRSALRLSTQNEVIVWCYWSNDIFNELNNRIIKRYQEQGATISEQGVPVHIDRIKVINRKPPKGNEHTAAQKVINWIESKPRGTLFKTKDIKDDLKMNETQWKDLVKENKYIKELMRLHSTNKRGIYTS